MSTNSEQTLNIPPLPLQFNGTIKLDGSKSISNRALIILALADANPTDFLSNLSTSNDTATLLQLLNQRDHTDHFDAGDAGTVFRFMSAYLAMRPGTQVLTGSKRMLERPIGPLVTALRQLGANITYLGQEGYPPLQIGDSDNMGAANHTLQVDAGVSSQFLSALLMIAPYLPHGIEIIPAGKMVSKPYLELTLDTMRTFGAACAWEGDTIRVWPGSYTPRPFQVEADWSAASYWYSFVALSQDAELHLKGLFAQSGQGDAVVADMMQAFGVETTFEDDGVKVTKTGTAKPVFEWDFLECPDIAQTLAVTCAATGVQGIFTGLETLSIKETDRIAAIRDELAKTGVSFSKLPARFNKRSPEKTYYLLDGSFHLPDSPPVRFATYGDHRMAMSFAPLALRQAIAIENPMVVGKSYPDFWNHLREVFGENANFDL